jgi:hypothetical protein
VFPSYVLLKKRRYKKYLKKRKIAKKQRLEKKLGKKRKREKKVAQKKKHHCFVHLCDYFVPNLFPCCS